MKICIVVDDYLPNSKKVAGKMMHEVAVEFLSRGHDVTVVTPDSDLKQKFKITSYPFNCRWLEWKPYSRICKYTCKV